MYVHHIIDQYTDYIKNWDFAEDKNKVIKRYINKISRVIKFHIEDYAFVDDAVKDVNERKKNYSCEEFLNQYKDYIRLPYNKCWFDTNITPTALISREEYIDNTLFGCSVPGNFDVPDKMGIYAYNIGNTKNRMIGIMPVYRHKNKKKWLSPCFHGIIDIKKNKFHSGFENTEQNRDRILSGNTPKELVYYELLTLRNAYLFLVKILVLLNCKNIIIEKINTPKRLNKKRKKNNKQELFDYHVLKLKVPTIKIINDEKNTNSSTLKRVHFCRGHIKRYTKEAPLLGKHIGIYWWQDHVRGSKKEGIIIKDYKI